MITKFLDVFKFDPNFEKNEAEYEEIRKEIIGDADDSSEDEEGEKEEDADVEAERNFWQNYIRSIKNNYI